MTDLTVSVSKAAKQFGVHPSTIRDWADNGRISSFRTPTGQRRIKLLNQHQNLQKEEKIRAIYCRVSSQKQRDDLQRQISFMQEKFKDYQIFQDIGSGINFKRKGLIALLDKCLQGMVSEVVVSSRDRLCRFAFELFEWLFERQGIKLTVLEQGDESPESELSNDVLSIIQVFCCRRNGKRRYSKQNAKSSIESDNKTEGSS
jgi:excisionase family DNA binding protein